MKFVIVDFFHLNLYMPFYNLHIFSIKSKKGLQNLVNYSFKIQ
jgi:hypothetical protein